jgi:hypothetical protein
MSGGHGDQMRDEQEGFFCGWNGRGRRGARALLRAQRQDRIDAAGAVRRDGL